ncbi:MAG: DUF2865 domain-containing protein [Hyphomicrobium sp.]
MTLSKFIQSLRVMPRAAPWPALAVAAALTMAVVASPVAAQSWWPFGGNDEPRRPPIPREPVYRPDAQDGPPPVQQPPAATNWSTKNPICLQLEQRLVQESQKGSQWRDQLPKIEAEMRQFDRTYNVGATKLDRSCYEYFLFTKTLRSTPQCKDLMREVEGAKRRLAELEAQRQDLINTGGRSYQDDIVRELARNNCGANYADQARRRDGGGGFGGFWQDEESVSGNTWAPQGAAGVATYRTLCVRLCDGYYFPVSFSTLPSHFPQDADLCASKCVAPTELYYYPNPGGSVDQSVALATQTPYTTLKTAFRYRKEFVNGCSCKQAEYDAVVAGGEKKADASGAAPRTSAATARGPEPVQSETLPPPETTGSTGTAEESAPVESTGPPINQGWQTQ